ENMDREGGFRRHGGRVRKSRGRKPCKGKSIARRIACRHSADRKRMRQLPQGISDVTPLGKVSSHSASFIASLNSSKRVEPDAPQTGRCRGRRQCVRILVFYDPRDNSCERIDTRACPRHRQRPHDVFDRRLFVLSRDPETEGRDTTWRRASAQYLVWRVLRAEYFPGYQGWHRRLERSAISHRNAGGHLAWWRASLSGFSLYVLPHHADLRPARSVRISENLARGCRPCSRSRIAFSIQYSPGTRDMEAALPQQEGIRAGSHAIRAMAARQLSRKRPRPLRRMSFAAQFSRCDRFEQALHRRPKSDGAGRRSGYHAGQTARLEDRRFRGSARDRNNSGRRPCRRDDGGCRGQHQAIERSRPQGHGSVSQVATGTFALSEVPATGVAVTSRPWPGLW